MVSVCLADIFTLPLTLMANYTIPRVMVSCFINQIVKLK